MKRNKSNLVEALECMEEIGANELSYEFNAISPSGKSYFIKVRIEEEYSRNEIKRYKEIRDKLEQLVCRENGCDPETNCDECDAKKEFESVMDKLDELHFGYILFEEDNDENCGTQEESE